MVDENQITVPPLGICVPVRVVKILDGDTVHVSATWSDLKWHIRLLDNWAPEVTGKHKEAGLWSRDALKRLLSVADDIRLYIPFDHYHNAVGSMMTFGRLLGHIYAGNINVSEWMCENGHSYKTKEELQEAGLYGK